MKNWTNNILLLNLKLDTLRSFLERVGKSVDQDYLDVSKRKDAGEFEDNDELSNALYDPMQAEKIAIRAVYYELNALIESELQHLAVDIANKDKDVSQEVSRLVCCIKSGRKLVWDLKISDLQRIIESHYKVQLDDLRGSKKAKKIRQIVNAYKHREGVQDPRKDKKGIRAFPQWYKLERKQAFQAINSVGDFFRALWSEINTRSNN